MSVTAFMGLSPAVLQALASSLRDGALSHAQSYRPIEQIVGAAADAVGDTIRGFEQEGMTRPQIGLLVAAVAETRQHIPDPSLVFELVLSGPSVEGIPTRQTAAVVRTLFAEAEKEVLVAGYAIHHGEEIFGPLHERMLTVPDLEVRLCFDIRRNEYLSDQDTIRSFAGEFTAKHWPWPEQPALYFYPRSLEDSSGDRGSLHAKCVIVDRRKALITSANFTEAAQNRNIEAGILIEYEPMATRFWRYFDSLVAAQYLQMVQHGRSAP